MRKQYYFQPSEQGILAWDVDRLIELSSQLPRRAVPLTAIRELDQDWHGDDERPTWRAMLEHVRLIDEADLAFPDHPGVERRRHGRHASSREGSLARPTGDRGGSVRQGSIA